MSNWLISALPDKQAASVDTKVGFEVTVVVARRLGVARTLNAFDVDTYTGTHSDVATVYDGKY